jgi:hypothetical protein
MFQLTYMKIHSSVSYHLIMPAVVTLNKYARAVAVAFDGQAGNRVLPQADLSAGLRG